MRKHAAAVTQTQTNIKAGGANEINIQDHMPYLHLWFHTLNWASQVTAVDRCASTLLRCAQLADAVSAQVGSKGGDELSLFRVL